MITCRRLKNDITAFKLTDETYPKWVIHDNIEIECNIPVKMTVKGYDGTITENDDIWIVNDNGIILVMTYDEFDKTYCDIKKQTTR